MFTSITPWPIVTDDFPCSVDGLSLLLFLSVHIIALITVIVLFLYEYFKTYRGIHFYFFTVPPRALASQRSNLSLRGRDRQSYGAGGNERMGNPSVLPLLQ